MNEFIEKLIGRLEEGREKSFSEYTEAFELYREEFWRGRMGGFTNAIEIVNQLAEEYNGGWIPVSDKLPDKDMWCLATFESGGIDKIQYLVTNKWGWNGEFADNKVVAWMPLPEPFKPIAE